MADVPSGLKSLPLSGRVSTGECGNPVVTILLGGLSRS
jgi:hypothetical protein